jgi:3-hydroxyisobutyrate dehydrogenase-like beta-hydroxyacid dehydrogenase
LNIKNDEKTEVTVIGLGDMGHALAQSLLNHNHTVSVWNRSAGKTNSLISKGAMFITQIADALTASSTTIICVSDHKSTMEILDSGGVFSASK